MAVVGDSSRHAAALDELIEWWQDLARQEINSRAVLLPVPSKWGRTYVLDKFAEIVADDEAVSIVVRIPGRALTGGLGVQALMLRDLFRNAHVEHRVAELLGVDRLGGVTQLGLSVAGLFLSPLAVLVGLLLASVGVATAGKAWDASPAGQEGMVARLARAVAAVSVSVPVVVTIDDADQLDPDLAVVLVENLIGRIDGRLLVVAAVNPGGELASALISRARYGLTEGRVRSVHTDPGMGYQARVDLAAELRPNLPGAATCRIGLRTSTFAEVFAVASAERLAEVDARGEDAASVTAVDEVIDAQVNRARPSDLAVVTAWAGGVLHVRQAERALEVLGENQASDDDGVIRFESLIRLADPASPRLAEQVRVLADSKRHRLAEIMIDTALDIGRDRQAGLVDKAVAWQAAHRVRTDLQNRAKLAGVQCQLVRSLESLGDPDAAYQVAKSALAEYPPTRPGEQQTSEQDDLSAAVLRLGRTRQSMRDDPFLDATVTAVAAAGAAVGLEARIWAAIDLLDQPGQRDRALKLIDQLTAELSRRNDLGEVANQWRLQLAFHVGRAGYPAIAQQLLAPVLTSPGPPEDADTARAVLYAIGGPGADIRLQIVGLKAEEAALPADADDDQLRVHHALAADYADLGDYPRALHHSQQELPLRRRIQGADHPDTLLTRYNIALSTEESGRPVEALRLFQELLPDRERVLGRSHPATLATRSYIARSTGEAGHPATALRLYQELLPDRERALGRFHPGTLDTRNNIAFWTWQTGNMVEALRLSQELLPDRSRILGPDHADILTMRSNIAAMTGVSGHLAEALRLFQELLPDQERVLGPDHPSTLTIRNSMAALTGESGHLAEALRLFQDLLPDQERVLGPDHPETLTTRGNIATATGRTGNPAEALRLFQGLLPDWKRVLSPDHPRTLTARNHIAFWTWQTGHPAKALQLLRELLPDQERVLGSNHPDTLETRSYIAALTGQPGARLRR